jgi:uncharacterized membrane protein HdeD (DUF308 family)
MTNIDGNSSQSATAALHCPTGRWWLCALLGLVMLAGGVFVLWNAIVASLVTALFFAAALVVGGVFQIVHAISARGWGSLALSLIIGLLLVGAGLLLATNPLVTSLALTLALAALFLVGGALRLWLAARHWQDHGWLLTMSGLLSVALGVVLIVGFPWSGLVVPGILIGVDLIFQGSWWLTVGLWVRRPHPGSGGTLAHA